MTFTAFLSLTKVTGLLLTLAAGTSLALAATTPLILTVEEMDDANLLENGLMEPGSDGTIKSWTSYPAGSPLIESLPPEPGADSQVATFRAGASVLGMHSELVEIKPNTAYSLFFEQKQESIHIGFNMGGGSMIRWYSERDARPKPLYLERLDGSFDWRSVSYSFVSPPDARYAQVSLTKTGLPGQAAFRAVRFAQGTLHKTKEVLRARDFAADAQAFGFFHQRLAIFLADKEGLSTPKLDREREAIVDDVNAAKAMVLQDAAARGLSPDASVQHEIRWAEMLKGGQGYVVRPDSPYYPTWKTLDERLNAYRRETIAWIERTQPERIAAAMRKNFGRYRGYGIGVDSPMLKIGRDQPYTGRLEGSARIALAREEEESIQMTLTALEEDLHGISLEVSALQRSDGATLPAKALSVSRIDQVRTSSPQYYTERVGWWPDIVYPAADVARITKGTNQSFWVTAAVPADTPAGDYHGTIRIHGQDGLLEEVPLQVRVWDVTLPRPGAFKVIGRFAPAQLKDFYRWKKMKPRVEANWNRYIFRKRWNSTNPFVTGLSPRGPALKAALEEGINAINLVNVSQLLQQDRPSRTFQWPDTAMEEKIQDAVRQAATEFRNAAGPDHKTTLYVFAFDEQHDVAQYKLMNHVFNLARKAVPEIKTMTTTTYSPLDDLVGSVDTWVPLLGSETPDVAARGAQGDERFFYVYGHPFLPFPNPSLIDQPGTDGRITFWLAAREGYTGFLHWLMNGWKANVKEGQQWPQIDWDPFASTRNGEGNFLYPGPNEEPISSVRFELIRDGIEDWEMITLLKKELANHSAGDLHQQGQKALAAAMALVPAADQCNRDRHQLMECREALAEALVALKTTGR